MKLIFASSNPEKVKEIKELLPQFEILSLLDFPNIPDVEETGATLLENAQLKAQTIAKHFNYRYPVFADDSGFFVDALDGAPGVHSARWTGQHRDYETQNQTILELLKKETNRRASYKTIICYVHSKRITYFFSGKMPLTVAEKESSTKGFSYDSIVKYQDQYVSEMSPTEKNKVSARGQALKQLADFLKD